MIITPHMLVGTAIGTQFNNPWSVFILGFLSHYILDALPHWEYLPDLKIFKPKYLKKIGLDFAFGGFFVLILTWSSPQKLFILIGLLAALSPDFLSVLYDNFNIRGLRTLFLIHHKIHFQKEVSFWPGLPFPLIISLIALSILVFDKWG